MSFRSKHETLRLARRVLNLREDAERAEIEAHVARMRAETEAIIATSRPRIQPRLREVLRETEADYLQGDYDMVGSRQSSEWGE